MSHGHLALIAGLGLAVGAAGHRAAGAPAAAAPAPSAPAAPAAAAAPAPSTPAAPAAAAPAPLAPAPGAPAIAAVVADLADVRNSTLVGRSAQLYRPDAAAPGSWRREVAGGVAPDVRGAALWSGELVVASATAPLFRHRDGQWSVAPVGQRGRVVLGSGPAFAVAIGRNVFTWSDGKLTRQGAVAEAVIALWAADERRIFVATAKGVWRRSGATFALVPQTAGALGFSGATPHAITAAAAIDLRSGARAALPGTGALAVPSARAPAAIVTTADGAPMLVRDVAARPPVAAGLPISSVPSTAAVDARGGALLVAAGAVHLFDGARWTSPALVDRLPPSKAGPAPAQSR